MEFDKREFLKQLCAGAFSAGSFATITASESDPEQTAVEVATNEEKELLVFTSPHEHVLCLYLATGTTSVDEPANDITRITDPIDGSVMDIKWSDTSTIEYWQNSDIIELGVNADGSTGQQTKVEDQSFPDGMISTPTTNSVENDEVGTNSPPKVCSTDIDPSCGGGGGGGGDDGGSGGDDGGSGGDDGGSGGDDGGSGGDDGGSGGDDGGSGGGGDGDDGNDDPDWMDNPDYEHDAFQSCKGAEFGEVCINTTSVTPKYHAVCNGNEVPLVGVSFNSVGITVPSKVASVAIDIWAGYNLNTHCLYWGSSMFNECEKRCFGSPPSPAEIENAFKDSIINAIDELKDDIPDAIEVAWELLKWLIYLAVLAALIFLATIATGGSATA